MMRNEFSWSALLLLSATSAVGLMVGCGDDDEGTTTAPSGPTAVSTTTTSGMGGSGAAGGATTTSTGEGGTGAMGGSGGAGGMGGAGGSTMADNQLANPDFEAFTGDAPDGWTTFGAQIPFVAVGYTQHAAQAHNAFIFNPSDPNDESNLFPGRNDSQALKMWGRGLDDGGTAFLQSLGTVLQEWGNSAIPVGSTLTLTGWYYHSSVDPLGTESSAYLVIKCYPGDFSAELCGAGGTKSTEITSATAADTWTQLSVEVPSLPAGAEVVQAAVEFAQCNQGAGCTLEEGKGAIFWDDLYFAWE